MAGSCARTEILVGQLGLAQLAESHVVIAGLVESVELAQNLFVEQELAN